jgi:hypothetical protein
MISSFGKPYEISLIVLIGVILGASIPSFPMVAVIVLGLLYSFLLFKSATTRLLTTIIGSLLVFQSSDGVGLLKIGFLACLGIITVSSLIGSYKYLKEEKYKHIRTIIVYGAVFLLYIIVNMGFSFIRGNDVMSALRDCVPYIIFSVSPILALDFAMNIKRKNLFSFFLLTGIYGTFSCVYTWVQLRNITDIESFNNIGLASYMLAYAFFTYCCVNALRGKKKIFGWTLAAGLVLGGLAITGTRTSFVVLTAGFIVIILSGRDMSSFQKILRGFRVFITLLITTTVGAVILLNITNVDKTIFLDRMKMSLVLFDQEKLANDNSIYMRASQTNAAVDAIKESPLVGMGPGYVFQTNNWDGKIQYRSSLDSPLAITAKHGIVGSIILLLFLWKIYMYIRNTNKDKQYSLTTYYLLGFLGINLITMLIIPTVEDKGLSIAILLLLALSFNELKDSGKMLNKGGL